MVRARVALRGGRRRSLLGAVAVAAAVATLTGTGGVAAAAQPVVPAGGGGPTKAAMHAHFAAPMPAPHSGVGVYTPPAGSAGSGTPWTPKAAVVAPAEGWTTYSHWSSGTGGKVTEQIYPQPEFRPSGQGWQQIDPSVHSNDHGMPAGAEGALRPVRFGGRADDLLEIELDNGPVTLSAPSLGVGNTQVNADGVTYSNVARDASISYSINARALNEAITLGSAAAPTSYTFHLSDPRHQLGSLVDNHDGSYSFSGLIDGDVRVELAPAYAYQPPETGLTPALVNGSAHQNVIASGDGFDITESVDPQWLAGKTFPVVLDPTVSFTDSNGTMYAGETYTSGDSRDTCYGGVCGIDSTNSDLGVGSYDLGPASPPSAPYQIVDERDLFQFNLSSIPPGSNITAASMNMYTTACVGEPNGQTSSTYQCSTNWTTPSDAYTTALDQVTQSWDPNTLTWNGLNGIYGSAIASNHTAPFTVTTPCNGTCFWMTWNVASEVQGWFNGTIPNYGFMARNVDENYWIAGPGWSYLGIYGSGGYGNPHPYLSVTYDPAPSAPTNVSASAGNAQATVTWGAASTNGGSAVSSYKIQTYQNGAYTGQTTTACGTCTSATVTGLTNGLGYSFNVYATDADGLSGPAAMSNTVTPQAAPTISKSVTNLADPGSAIASAGQTLQYTLTVTNSQSGPMSINVQDTLPAGLLGSTLPTVALGGALSGTCTTTSSPSCTDPTGHLLSVSNFTLPAGTDATFTYDAVAVTTGTGCLSVANSVSATNTNSGGSSSTYSVSTPICDNGLGIEPWWSYLTKTLGSDQTASLNAADGNLVVQGTDSTEITGHGHLGFVLRRTYNSEDTTLATLPGSLGRGWVFNVAQADDLATAGVTSTGLYVPSDQQVTRPLAVTMIDRDGTRLVFTPKATNVGAPAISAISTASLTGTLATLIPRVLKAASGDVVCVDETYSPPAGVHLGLWRYIQTSASSCSGLTNSNAQLLGYAAVRPDRLRYEYNATGQLLDMTDGNGVDLRYRYDSQNRLSQVFQSTCDPIVQASCKAYSFSYPSGTETDVTDPAGRATKYLFYNNTSTGAPAGLYLTQVVNSDGSKLNYTYSGVNATPACGSSTGQMCSAVDLRGHSTSFAYASNATVALAPGPLSSITDRLGTTTSVSYTATSMTATENAEVTTYRSIDSAGRVGEIQDADTSNNLYHDSFYTWDTTGRTCQQPGNTVDNNLCELKHTAFNDTETGKSNGITTPDSDTTYIYNNEGQLLDQRQQTGSGSLDATFGYVADYVQADGSTAYDNVADTVAGSGNVNSAARPSGTEAAQALYVISDRTQSLTPLGNSVGSGYGTYLTTYKVENNPADNPNATPATQPCAENTRGSSFSPADNSGDLCETDAPDYDGTHQTITSYIYDTSGEKTSMTNPNGGTYSYTYYTDTQTDISGHTSAGGWLATVTDPDKQFVAYGYDAAGDIVYTWDRNATNRNNLPSTSYPGTSNASSCGSGLPSGYSTVKYGPYAGAPGSWCADPWRYKLADVDPLGNTTSYTVDADGNQLSVQSPRGNTTTQTFNNADELASKLLPAEAASGAATTWGYDPYGNKTSMTDPNGNVTVYRYDNANRLVETDFTRGAWPSDTSTVPAACRESTSTDAPIPAGRILCSTTAAYDGLDNVTAAQDANHQTTTKHYDAVHRLTEVDAPTNSTGGAALKTGYIYNPDGKTTDICNPREYTDGGQSSCVTSPAYGSHMTYDALDRMTTKTVGRASGVVETTSYTYDPDGNQLSVKDPNGHTTTFGYDVLDRKTSMTVPRDANTTNTTYWTYDPSGDVTSMTQPGSLNLGTGANGPLVVDGTTATSSTNRSCPQSNPCVFPTDFTAAAQGGNYTTITLQNGGWVTAAAYNGSTGGTLTWDATGALSVCATCGITLNGKGPGGGAGGTSLSGNAANGSGDGPGHGGGNNATTGGGGGGAGHANGGAAGVKHLSTDGAAGSGGSPYGSLSGAGQTGVAAMGSGGGGGGDGATNHGAGGGAGAGGIRITALSIDDEGIFSANGNGGGGTSGLTGGGGGGGGSGGSVWLTAPSVTLGDVNAVEVDGGPGGTGAGSDNGGNGSVGLVRFDTNSLAGTGAAGNTSWTQTNAVITPLGRVTAYSYDNDNRLVDTVTGADNTNAAAAGVDGDGTKNVRTRNFYDRDGNLVAQLLPGAFATSTSSPNDDYLTRTDYDTDGRALNTYEPRYDPAHPEPGLSSTQAAQCPNPPRVTPASIAGVPNYPTGVGVCVTQTSYDPDGNPTKVVLPTSNGSDNRYITYTYSDDNLLTSVNAPNPANNGTRQTAVSYLYDGDGKQVKQTLVPNDTTNTQATTTAYYPNESVQQTAGQAYTPSGSNTQITHVTKYAYDADGNTLTVTDPAGNVTTSTYTNDDLTATVTDGAADKTTYSYDPDGNPSTVSSPSATAKDATNPSGTPTSYTYTYDNLPLTLTTPVTANGATLRETTYSYDQGGRKTSQTVNDVNSSGGVTAAGGTQSFSYFNDDRLSGQTGRNNEQIAYNYDPAGNPTAISDNTSGVTISASYYLDELPLAVNDGSRCSQYSYDGLGQPAARADATYSGGACSTSGRYVTTYAYGDAETLTSNNSAAAAGKTTSYAYDDLARPTSDTLPNGLNLTRAYNPDSTLQNQTETGSAGTVASYGDAYNNNYEITSQTFAGKAATGGTLNTNTLSYGYDAANRVTSFTNGATTNNISYDHDSNRLGYGPGDTTTTCTPSSTTTCFTYNADDSINTASDANGNHNFTYNPLGDQTADACNTYTYDGLDRLTKTTPITGAAGCPAATTSTYTYDGLDRQHTDNTTTANTTLRYDGLTANVSEETNTTTGIDTIYQLLPGGAKTALTQETPVAPTTQYLTSDGINNISTITDTSGNPACTLRYDPYGNPLNPQSATNPCDTGTSSLDNYYYQDARRDPTTGQYQLGSRTYDPTKASYLTPDTYRANQPQADQSIHTDPLTQNTYTYVNGDPLNFDDPTGHRPACMDGDNCAAVYHAYESSITSNYSAYEAAQSQYAAEEEAAYKASIVARYISAEGQSTPNAVNLSGDWIDSILGGLNAVGSGAYQIGAGFWQSTGGAVATCASHLIGCARGLDSLVFSVQSGQFGASLVTGKPTQGFLWNKPVNARSVAASAIDLKDFESGHYLRGTGAILGVLAPLGFGAASKVADVAEASYAADAANAARAAELGTEGASVANTEPLALPRGSPTLAQDALEHIVERHWATSDAANAGKFAVDTTGQSLKAMIEDAVGGGSFRPNTLNRPGWIYEYDFGSKIGIDIGGNDTSWLRVVLNPDNTVRTAFPFSP